MTFYEISFMTFLLNDNIYSRFLLSFLEMVYRYTAEDVDKMIANENKKEMGSTDSFDEESAISNSSKSCQ